MIRINLIPILVAIAKEYSNDELFKRLPNILNIDLTSLIGTNTKLEYTPTKLIITTDKVKHIIELCEDYYTYTKDFESYKIIKHYDYSKTIIRKSAIFNTSDNELLVVDEIDEENIKNRRIIKTTKEDTDFTNGYFEKEELKYHKHPISERYRYQEDILCNKKVSKQVRMPNNLYVYSYRTTIDAVSREYHYGYIESASCINRPTLLVPGRIRENNELLISSIKTPLPNILIRGRNIVPTEETEIELYNISIYKIGNEIQFILRTTHLPDNIQTSEEHSIKSNTYGGITLKDLELLLEFISKNLDTPYVNEVKQELLNIQNQLLISTNKKLQPRDFFDTRFMMFKDFEYLVFDIYTNLSTYEEIISKQVRKNPEDTPPTLKKTQ